jgi:hypothetical protein
MYYFEPHKMYLLFLIHFLLNYQGHTRLQLGLDGL